MRVNDLNSGGVSSSQLGQSQQTQGVGPRGRQHGVGAGAEGAGDQVQLSDLASNVRELAADSPERSARLERLSQAVASQSYRVDATELSRRIVDDALKPGI